MNLISIDVATPAAAAQLFLHGAHLARWTPAHAQAPVLWLSAHSHFSHDTSIRGGVPICFPWFGPHASDPTAPAHGFARLAEWTLLERSESADGTVSLSLMLDTADHRSPRWPHRCRVGYDVSVGTTLHMTLTVENTSAEPFAFEEALHTYLAVSDITHVSIAGLERTEYLDKVRGFARTRQGDEAVRFAGETDRVYLDTEATCRVIDPGYAREIIVRKSGSRTTVVWNPWAEKARAMRDFGADEWRQMVCVETANVGAAAVHLPPGASHQMRAEIECRAITGREPRIASGHASAGGVRS